MGVFDQHAAGDEPKSGMRRAVMNFHLRRQHQMSDDLDDLLAELDTSDSPARPSRNAAVVGTPSPPKYTG